MKFAWKKLLVIMFAGLLSTSVMAAKQDTTNQSAQTSSTKIKAKKHYRCRYVKKCRKNKKGKKVCRRVKVCKKKAKKKA
jgi:hypothetical protein